MNESLHHGIVVPHASGARVVVTELHIESGWRGVLEGVPGEKFFASRIAHAGERWPGRVARTRPIAYPPLADGEMPPYARSPTPHPTDLGEHARERRRTEDRDAFPRRRAPRRIAPVWIMAGSRSPRRGAMRRRPWHSLCEVFCMPADSALVLDTPFTPAHVPPPPSLELVTIKPKRAFARRDVFTPAWLPMCASRELKKGQAKPRTIDLGVMKIVLWRDDDGAVHAMESRCPHMGADLGHGRVVEGELRCALHHWRFRGDDGACTHSSASTPVRRCATTFPVVEWCGVVFVYPARTPAIAFPAQPGLLPGGESVSNYRVVVLGEAKLKCHWHLPTANGLDPVHFEGLHGFESLSPWTHDVDEANGAVNLHLDHRPKSPVLRALLGDLQSRFSTIGPSIAWVSAKAPVRMHGFFATRPHADGGCISRVILFLPREKPLATLRVLAHVVRLLWQDGVMLNSMHDFRPGYVDTDAPLRAHTKIVDAWPR